MDDVLAAYAAEDDREVQMRGGAARTRRLRRGRDRCIGAEEAGAAARPAAGVPDLPAPVWRLVRDVGHGHDRLAAPGAEARLERSWRASAETSTARSTAVTYRGERLLARPVERFRARRRPRGNAAFVADALEAAGVRYLVVDARGAAAPRRWPSPRSRPDAAWRGAAAGRPDGSRSTSGSCTRAATGPSIRLAVRPRMHRRGASAYTVFQVMRRPGSTEAHVGGPSWVASLEFWRTLEEDSPADHAHRRAAGRRVLGGAAAQPLGRRRPRRASGSRCGGTSTGSPGPRCPRLAGRHVFDVDFPIDVVYTGSTAATRRGRSARPPRTRRVRSRRAQRVRQQRVPLPVAGRAALLAALAGHVRRLGPARLPGHRRPGAAWLDTDNPRITVVDHRELFGDRGRLPTFNSHAIESQLHHIPG